MEDYIVTPESFIKHAQEFFSAADLVLNKAVGVSIPAYFLLGRSIELSLKAFLLHKGVPIEELRSRKYGHDLVALLRSAKELDLSKHTDIELDGLETGVIELLSFDYKEKRFEYRTTGTYCLPYIEVTWSSARKLANAIEKHILPEETQDWSNFFEQPRS